MCESTNTNIERRVLMRAIVETLAEPLEGESRERFLASANEAINREFPIPSRQAMREFLARMT
jgi:hypothetical protein